MNPIVKNRHLDALLKLMLLSAVLHMAVLAIYFVLHVDATRFNFFKIINIDLLYPRLVTNSLTNFYSTVVMVVLYLFFYTFSSKRK